MRQSSMPHFSCACSDGCSSFAACSQSPRGVPPPRPSPASGSGGVSAIVRPSEFNNDDVLSSTPFTTRRTRLPLPLAGEDRGGGVSADRMYEKSFRLTQARCLQRVGR